MEIGTRASRRPARADGAVPLSLERSGDRLRFPVRVTPRAARDAAGGTRDGALVVRVTAAPVRGAANAALVAVLAKALGVARSELRLERGERGRDKLVSAPAAARSRLERLAAAGEM